MLKKILLPILLVVCLVISCKKSSSGPDKKDTNYKNLDFNASAPNPIKVVIKITRPATDGVSVDVQLVYISQSNIIPPYRYAETNFQTGDHVNIAVYTTQNKTITGTVIIDGVGKASTYTNLNTADGLSTAEWDHYVD